jgi:hypothetical protein
MEMRIYEATLARPDMIQRARDAQPEITRLGGKIEIGPPAPAGVRLVRLILPAPLTPDEVLPGVPFFSA